MDEFFNVLEGIEEREIILKKLSNKIKDREILLDIATGSGYLIRNLLDKNITIVCLDLNSEVLKKLKTELDAKEKKVKLYYVCCDATKLPFKNSSFSTVTAWSAMAHIPEWKKLLDELYRVAERILLLEPDGGFSVRAFRDFRVKHGMPEYIEVIKKAKKMGKVRSLKYPLFYEIEIMKELLK